MKITANLENLFIPKFSGNQELPQGEQITVEIKRPTSSQRETLRGYRMDQAGNFSVGFNVDRILRHHVGKITNLESTVNGKTFVIGDGTALADDTNPNLAALVDEIKAEITRNASLDEDEVKN